jgi:hypothetical protein
MTDPWSENLEGSWTTERKGSLGAIVGTRVSYAPWVQSAEKQQPMHGATGWVTDQRAVDEVVASGVIDRIFSNAVDKAI